MQDKNIGTGTGARTERIELPPRGRFQLDRLSLLRLLDHATGCLLRYRIVSGKIRPYVHPLYLSGLAGGGAPVAELLAVDLGDALPLLLRVHDLDSIRVWLETWEAQGGAYGSLLIADGGTDHADPWRIWPLDDGAEATA